MDATKPRNLSEAIDFATDRRTATPAVFWDADRRNALVVLRHHDDGQEWAVAFRLARTGEHRGQARMVEFAVRQVDSSSASGSSMSGHTIRALPIGELLSVAREQAASSRRADEPQPTRVRFILPGEDRLAPFLDRRRSAQRDDRAYAALAMEYAFLVEDGVTSPAKALADRLGGKAGTWTNRITEARRRGLLTPVKGGAAGGAMTDKALRLLGGPDEE
jgi:hypothetical protein